MNSNYEAGFAHLMKIAGLEKTAVNTKLLQRLLDAEHPNAPVSAERLQWGRRTGDWDEVPDAMIKWVDKVDAKYTRDHVENPWAREEALRRLWYKTPSQKAFEESQENTKMLFGKPWKWKNNYAEHPLEDASTNLHARIEDALPYNLNRIKNNLPYDGASGDVLLRILRTADQPIPDAWVREGPPKWVSSSDAISVLPPELLADIYTTPTKPTSSKRLEAIQNSVYLKGNISEEARRGVGNASIDASNKRREKLEDILRMRGFNIDGHAAERKVRPEISTVNFDTGTPTDNPTMFDPKTRAYRGQSIYKRVSSRDPTWVTGHPDLSYQYTDPDDLLGTRIFEFDPSKIPKKDQGPWHGHLATDTRRKTPKQVAKLPIYNENPIGTSPYYEKVVTEGALRPALTKRWRPTPDGGLELMEDFAKSKGTKPEF